MRNVIRLGDDTSHGGKVIQCSLTHFTIDGIPVACEGDTCTCPIPGHCGCKIISGSPRHTVNGKRLAFDGDKTSCGAVLIASRDNFSTA
ncbi:PAAR domain-containing protein [Pseudoduganella ginsengisoli]|uniref:PAAR domain-containing protein n=1 Tax=Pseudoduganella ginsengisoli TaxID=1462440 RepID=A0A6L6PUT7_9BURK|nr:PAAR domain-containing protein [Pseudoduganella ginsengisoli]MTW01009.1 PAAR domain-containing protein [Pseudoduganella ginsengisoli]